MKRFCLASFISLIVILQLACGNQTSNTPPPSSLAIAISPTFVSLYAQQTQQFTATVTGNASAVTWSIAGCSQEDCGSITTDGLYTAPSVIPNQTTVYVKATVGSDSKKSAIASVAQNPLWIDIGGGDVTLGAGKTHQFYAAVNGHPNTGISWTLSSCTGEVCGTIKSDGLYTSPAHISAPRTLTLTATSLADPSKSDTVAIYHIPLTVWVDPPVARLTPGASQLFSASTPPDTTGVGVTWSLGPSCTAECGTLSSITSTTVMYTAPATDSTAPSITLSAASIADPAKTARASIKVSDAPALQAGDYVFFFNGWMEWAGVALIAGHFHCDGAGNITGIEDINGPGGVSESLPITGGYHIGPDGRGTLTIVNEQESVTYSLSVDAKGRKGKIAQLSYFAFVPGNGYLEIQDTSSFSAESLAGTYALGVFGRVDTNPLSAAGRLTLSDIGVLSNGRMDATMLTGTPQAFSNLSVTGTFGPPAADSGRGTGSINITPNPPFAAGTLNFVYYAVSGEKILLLQTDLRGATIPVVGGYMHRQEGPFSLSSLNSPVIFSASGESWFGSTVAIGRLMPDGLGGMSGRIDLNDSAITDDAPRLNESFVGNYAVEEDGRATIRWQLASGPTFNQIAYLFGDNEGVMIGSATRPEVAIGSIRAQAGAPFSISTLAGAYLSAPTPRRISPWVQNDFSLTIFDTAGTVLSTMEAVGFFGLDRFDSSGTYVVTEDGRGSINFILPPPDSTQVFWAISPTELIGLSPSYVYGFPAALDYDKW